MKQKMDPIDSDLLTYEEFASYFTKVPSIRTISLWASNARKGLLDKTRLLPSEVIKLEHCKNRYRIAYSAVVRLRKQYQDKLKDSFSDINTTVSGRTQEKANQGAKNYLENKLQYTKYAQLLKEQDNGT